MLRLIKEAIIFPLRVFNIFIWFKFNITTGGTKGQRKQFFHVHQKK